MRDNLRVGYEETLAPKIVSRSAYGGAVYTGNAYRRTPSLRYRNAKRTVARVRSDLYRGSDWDGNVKAALYNLAIAAGGTFLIVFIAIAVFLRG